MAKEENTPTTAQKKAAAASAAAPAAPQYVPSPVVPTNVLAIVSLVTGILGFTFAPFISSLAAVITGHLSLHQIKSTGEQGRGMALTGLILGYVMLGLALIAISIIIFLIVVSFNGMAYSGQMPRLRGGI